MVKRLSTAALDCSCKAALLAARVRCMAVLSCMGMLSRMGMGSCMCIVALPMQGRLHGPHARQRNRRSSSSRPLQRR